MLRHLQQIEQLARAPLPSIEEARMSAWQGVVEFHLLREPLMQLPHHVAELGRLELTSFVRHGGRMHDVGEHAGGTNGAGELERFAAETHGTRVHPAEPMRAPFYLRGEPLDRYAGRRDDWRWRRRLASRHLEVGASARSVR